MNARLLSISAVSLLAAGLPASAADYDILISKETRAKADWAAVADMLAGKHGGTVIEYGVHPAEALDTLRRDHPRYVCVVAEPASLDRVFVVAMNRLSRKIDDDIFTDCLWGIITGYEAGDALRIAKENQPLVLESGLHTTGCDHASLKKNMVISDGAAGRVETRDGSEPRKDVTIPDNGEGSVFEFRNRWNEAAPDFMVTSSHATQYNLEMPFGRGLIVSYGNRFHVLRKDQLRSFARFLGGALFKGDEKDMIDFCDSLNAPVLGDRGGRPAVWLGAGNCLLGDAKKSRNSMVVTALSGGGFNQLVGYVVPTWYGRMGWGTLKVFTSQGDRLSLAEAFFLNNQDLLAETLRRFPKALAVEFNEDDVETWMKKPEAVQALADAGYLTKETAKDALGLVHDRDVVAFYGDPAWRAGFAKPATPAYQLEFGKASEDGLSVTVSNPGENEWKGDVFSMLPERIPAAECNEDPASVTVADDFVLFHDFSLKPGGKKTIRITSRIKS